MNRPLTICQLWVRFARVFNVFNVFAREQTRVLLREQNGALYPASNTQQHR